MIRRVLLSINQRRADIERPVRDRKHAVGTTMRTIKSQGGFRAKVSADFVMRGTEGSL